MGEKYRSWYTNTWIAWSCGVALWLSRTTVAAGSTEEFYLYYGDTDASTYVQEYRATKDGIPLDGLFEQSEHPRIVEFYSPYCPHCRHFKPKYVRLARDVGQKYPDVEFYAVSCVAHSDMCQKYNVRGFPQILALSASTAEPTVLSKNSYTVRGIASALKLGPVLGGTSTGTVGRTVRLLEDGTEAGDSDEPPNDDSEQTVDQPDENSNDPSLDGKVSFELHVPIPDLRPHPTGDDVPNSNDPSADEKTEDEPADSQDTRKHYSGEDPTVGNGLFNVDIDDSPDEGFDQSADDRDDPDAEEYYSDNRDDEDLDESEDQESEQDPYGMDLFFEAQKRGGDESESSDLPGPVQRKPGAVTAQFAPRDMDKYRDVLRQKRAAEQKKRKFVGLRKDRQVKPLGPVVRDGASKAMRANTPGTLEYKQRQKESSERLAKLLEKKFGKKRAAKYVSSKGIGNRIGNYTSLPFKKEVAKPRLVEQLPILKRVVRMDDEEMLILDSSLSFLRGLRYGVFQDPKPLTGKKKRALKDWLDLLSGSLPQEWGLHEIIDDLLDNLDYIAQGSKNLHDILDKHPIQRRNWSRSCTKGGRNVNGFTCGFWKLLHVMTVGVAEHRGGKNLVATGLRRDIRVFAPMEAADTLREYMAHFFSCTECSKHFLVQYDQCDMNRRCGRLATDAHDATDSDWKELAKWLWEFHNDVSVHVLNERTDNKRKQMQQRAWRRAESGPGAAGLFEQVSVVWPSTLSCTECIKAAGTFDEDAVFTYLEQTYWPGLEDSIDRVIQFYDEHESGSKVLTLILLCIGAYLAFVMRKSLGPKSLQQSLIMARKMRPKGSVGVDKRSV